MAIQAPNFCKDAVPSLQGWRHPSTNELLKSQRLEQWQIDEWFGNTPAEEAKPVPAPQPVAVEVVEEPVLQTEELEVAPPPPPVAVAAPAPKKASAPKRKIGGRIKKAVNKAKAEVKDALD